MLYRINIFLTMVFIAGAGAEETLKVPLGLPEIPWPADNPYTKAKADLGRLLYFDKRLSANGTVSCSSCHSMNCGFSDCKVLAVGIDGKMGKRHSPTVINTAYAKLLFWDGRASSLEEQCKGPLANVNEMADEHTIREAHEKCVERIESIPGYQKLFAEVFGKEGVTIDTIAKAIATFERTVLSGNSPYDRYAAGDKTAMTEEQIRGMKVFKKVSCVNCHGGFNFTDDKFQNIGIGMDAEDPDLGRYKITKDKKDWGSFKTPTLRDTEHSAPYMHNGSLATLEEVVDYYDKGGIKNKNLHPLLRPLHMTPEDKKALISFLKALSGEGWQHFEEPKEFPK
jgi:cytochrome c peroxidase